MSTRAVRFSEAENEKIIEFLKKNDFLDFSTLARLSIMKFMEKPELKLNPIVSSSESNIKQDTRVH